MSDLAVLEKIDGIAMKPQSRFMLALAQSIPQGIGMLPARLMREAITVIKGSQALQKAGEYSLFASIAEVAEAGLSLNVHLGQAFLVPYSGVATVLYGYRGLCELARRSGECTDIVGEIRYAKDEWKLSLGSHRELIHIPLDEPASKRGPILGAYAVAELLHGKPVFEYMTAEDIERIRGAVLKRKRGDKPTPWEIAGAMEEMYRKTPVRRLAKRLPQSPSLIPFVQAAIRDEYRQAGLVETPNPSPMVAEALESSHIDPEPTKAPTGRRSAIKEKAKEVIVEEASGPITNEQFDQIYSLVTDLKLTVAADMVPLMKKLGHAGTPRQFPASKFAALVDKLREKAKR